MRVLIGAASIVFLFSHALVAQDPRPRPQDPGPQAPPVFRAGVELVSIDVTALDGNGRQVTDLTARDFQIEIDGDKRTVSTVEYIRSADPLRQIGAPHKVVVADETFSTSNAKGAPRGRLIVLLIDQGNIRTGAARHAMNSAKKFIDTLTPEDRVSVVAVPGPGELVDFTTNHDKVREALLRIVGTSDPLRSRFNLSVTEALALYSRSNAQLIAEVVSRSCGSLAGTDFDRCEREVDADAGEVANEIRRRTQESVHGMRSVLQSIAAVEGPKSVIVISEGLVFEGLGGETDDLALVAADARASIDVLQLAGAARGELYRINTTAEYAFDRISRALDGYYLLGVESRPDDRNGKRHRIGVKSLRRGVTLRSRRSFVTSMSAKSTTPSDAVTRAIRSPLPINDLPLKVSTWLYKQPATHKVRVIVAAEVERLAGQSLEYTVGMAIVNKQGRGFGQPVEVQKLTEKPGDEGTAMFTGMLAVDPGEYRVIVSMADSEGRVGSVARAVTAFQLDGPGLALGDLLVGSFDSGKPVIDASIEPAVSGPLAALMEAYAPALQSSPAGPGDAPFGLEATLDILGTEDGAPLASIPMRIGRGTSPEIANASAQFNTATLPPGRYLARGSIRHNGKPQGHMLRPFRIMAATATGATAAPGMMTQEMALVLLGGVANFDRKVLLTPAMLTAMFASAEARAAGSKAAVKEARGGDLGSAAMTALADNDQVLATFLKGLELYQSAQLDKAAVQFQSSMQMAPTFAPARLFLGAALAEGNRHKEAAGLIQSTSTNPPNAAIARLAGEEWIKAGQPALAIPTLERAVSEAATDMTAKKLLGIAYVLGGRSAEAVTVLTSYLETNPSDPAALLGAIFGTYNRHLSAPQPATLAADRANLAKWSKAYVGTKGPMQPLVAAWVNHVQSIK
jgi:VWFA-related protein